MIAIRHAMLNSQQANSQAQESMEIRETRETREYGVLGNGFSKIVTDDLSNGSAGDENQDSCAWAFS